MGAMAMERRFCLFPAAGKQKNQQLHFCKLLISRAENETRTRDPNLGKVVLYQLSYFRIISICLKLFVDRGVPYRFDVANVRRKIEFPNFVFTFF